MEHRRDAEPYDKALESVHLHEQPASRGVRSARVSRPKSTAHLCPSLSRRVSSSAALGRIGPASRWSRSVYGCSTREPLSRLRRGLEHAAEALGGPIPVGRACPTGSSAAKPEARLPAAPRARRQRDSRAATAIGKLYLASRPTICSRRADAARFTRDSMVDPQRLARGSSACARRVAEMRDEGSGSRAWTAPIRLASALRRDRARRAELALRRRA